jgi:hypothetical protein
VAGARGPARGLLLLRLHRAVPHGVRPAQRPNRLARELPDHDGGARSHTPVCRRWRRRDRADGVGAASLRDGAPAGGFAHGRVHGPSLRRLHGRAGHRRPRAVSARLAGLGAVCNHDHPDDLRRHGDLRVHRDGAATAGFRSADGGKRRRARAEGRARAAAGSGAEGRGHRRAHGDRADAREAARTTRRARLVGL